MCYCHCSALLICYYRPCVVSRVCCLFSVTHCRPCNFLLSRHTSTFDLIHILSPLTSPPFLRSPPLPSLSLPPYPSPFTSPSPPSLPCQFDIYIKQTLSAISGRRPTDQMMEAVRKLSEDPHNAVVRHCTSTSLPRHLTSLSPTLSPIPLRPILFCPMFYSPSLFFEPI